MAVNYAVMQSPTVTIPHGILSANHGDGSAVRPSSNLSFMHRAPTIMPNYGKTCKVGLKLKTNVPKVLLQDNMTQQSILSSQLSGIESQYYKTRRQLEMNIKSFLLLKQRKDKALRKLTKVHHAEDYATFELEYYGYTRDTNGGTIEGNHLKRFTLPSVHTEKGTQMPVRNWRRPMGNSVGIIFPQVARMFPVFSNKEEARCEALDYEPTVCEQHTKPEAANAANLQTETVIDCKSISSENIHEPREAIMYQTVDIYTGNVKTAEKRQPMQDYRFELLRKTLIPQDPPNEGFAELSPSFIKPAHFQYFRERSVYIDELEPHSTVSMNMDRSRSKFSM